MLELKDGPCKGTYLVKRSPMFLRAVKDEMTGETDILDQPEDTPINAERVFVYQIEGSAGAVHIHGKVSGWYAMATYHHLPEVDGESLREKEQWLAWAKAQVAEK